MAAQHSGQARAWRVEITSGCHRGAVVELGEGRHSVGRHHDNDIVLADEAVADRQAVLEITSRQALLVALAPGASLRERPLPAGRSRRLAKRTELRLGATRLRLLGPAQERRWPGGFLPRAALATACVAALATIPPLRINAMTLLQQAVGTASRSSSAPTPAAAAVSRQAGAGLRPGPAEARLAFAKAAGTLRAHLASVQLDRAVELSVTGDGLLATGALGPDERERWLAAQVWFDTANPGHPTLLDQVGDAHAERMPRLDVRAVSVGAVPFVITGSGDRYAEGSVLADGWTIAAIAADHVSLRNGARTMDIRL